MYAKVIDNKIVKYPYSIQELKEDYPEVLFPHTYPEEVLAQYNCYRVLETAKPDYNIEKNIIESTPTFDGTVCHKTWEEVSVPYEEVEQRVKHLNKIVETQRLEAYREEADPLFFKWQREEATKEEWLNKVAEIKLRYPDIER